MREISLHILDIVQNSLRAEATKVDIVVKEDKEKDLLALEIVDNGRGMGEEDLKRALDPFFTTRTTRKVGLGLSLLQASAQACQGDLILESVLGQGTTVKAFFSLQHIDRPPLGDMAATLLTLVSTSPEIDFSYRHEVNGREFSFNTKDMRDILAGVALNNHQVLAWLKEYLLDHEKALYQD